MLETTQKHLGHIPQWEGIIYYKRGGLYCCRVERHELLRAFQAGGLMEVGVWGLAGGRWNKWAGSPRQPAHFLRWSQDVRREGRRDEGSCQGRMDQMCSVLGRKSKQSKRVKPKSH